MPRIAPPPDGNDTGGKPGPLLPGAKALPSFELGDAVSRRPPLPPEEAEEATAWRLPTPALAIATSANAASLYGAG